MRQRILALLREYPQTSQTYKETELRYLLARGHTIRVASYRPPNLATLSHLAYDRLDERSPAALREIIKEFAPTVVHGHYLHHTPRLFAAAEAAGVGFTVRGHSYDVLGRRGTELPRCTEMLNSSLFLGVLIFPFAHRLLLDAGVWEDKLIDCWPVVDYEMFHDESPNGNAVLNVGACLPKKDHPTYLDVAAADRTGRTFTLFPLGYDVAELTRQDDRLGAPVTVHPPVPHDRMPKVYKRHGWMVYTASAELNTVGWPLAAAEAQASGVVVAIQNLRPDLAEYIGPGFVFDTATEAAELIAQPPPAQLRSEGFVHALRSDVAGHLTLLEELWAAAR